VGVASTRGQRITHKGNKRIAVARTPDVQQLFGSSNTHITATGPSPAGLSPPLDPGGELWPKISGFGSMAWLITMQTRQRHRQQRRQQYHTHQHHRSTEHLMPDGGMRDALALATRASRALAHAHAHTRVELELAVYSTYMLYRPFCRLWSQALGFIGSASTSTAYSTVQYRTAHLALRIWKDLADHVPCLCGCGWTTTTATFFGLYVQKLECIRKGRQRKKTKTDVPTYLFFEIF
jgi:hypothetical protein